MNGLTVCRASSDQQSQNWFGLPSKQNRPDPALRTFLTASFLFSFEVKIESEVSRE
jgi:hypothetical protein